MLRIARISVAGSYRKREHQPAVLLLDTSAVVEADEGKESLALASLHPAVDPVYQAEAREEWGEVVKAINALSEEQRQVLVSRLILGYDVETVARMPGKKGNAIKALQFRALQSLHRLLLMQGVARQTLRSRSGVGKQLVNSHLNPCMTSWNGLIVAPGMPGWPSSN